MHVLFIVHPPMASSSLMVSLLLLLCLVFSSSALAVPDNYVHQDAPAPAAVKTLSCRYHEQHHQQLQLQGHHLFRRGHYTFLPNAPQWNRKLGPRPRTLTYALSPDHSYDLLGREEILKALRGALGRWEAVIPLRFKETTDYREADIKIGFYEGEHGSGLQFDGRGGIMAYAIPMSETHGAKVSMDAEEHWTTDLGKDTDEQATDLETVLVHELGHVWGLGHTTTRSAVMYPSLLWRERKVELDEEDIHGVKELFRLKPSISWNTATMAELIVNCKKFQRCGVLWSIMAAVWLVVAAVWLTIWWCVYVKVCKPLKEEEEAERRRKKEAKIVILMPKRACKVV